MSSATARPWDTETRRTTCTECGAGVVYEAFVGSCDLDIICDQCSERLAREADEADAEERRRRIYRETGIPEEFCMFRRELAWEFGAILDWVVAHKWESLFVASRTSGIGKTRATAYAALEMAREGEDVRWVLGTEWLRNTCRMMGSDEAADAEARIRALKRCRLLVIDDLGTEIMTARAAEIIWEIIDSRTRGKHRRTWITSNCSGDELANRMGSVGAKTMRRIRDVCTQWDPKAAERGA